MSGKRSNSRGRSTTHTKAIGAAIGAAVVLVAQQLPDLFWRRLIEVLAPVGSAFAISISIFVSNSWARLEKNFERKRNFNTVHQQINSPLLSPEAKQELRELYEESVLKDLSEDLNIPRKAIPGASDNTRK